MKSNWVNMLYKYSFSVATLLVIRSVASMIYGSLLPYIYKPFRDISRDIDWEFINRGLDGIHGARDTLQWWTGTWCGEVPFWRPLASYVFLLERLLWPQEFMLPRQIIAVCAHMVFLFLSAALLWRITYKKWLVITAIWLFAGARPFPISLLFSGCESVREALSDPKNIPDFFSGISIVLSLLLLTYARWGLGLIFAIIGVCFKEIGFTAWPLAGIMIAWLNREKILTHGGMPFVLACIRKNWLPTLFWLLALGSLGLVHWVSVGFGYSLGSNEAWWWRTITFFGCPLICYFLSHEKAPVVIVCLAFIFLLLLRRRSLVYKLIGMLVAFTVGVVADAHQLAIPWQVSMTRLLLPDGALPAIIACGFWLLAAWEARQDWQIITLGLLLAIISSAPTFFVAQALPHTRYVASMFLSMVSAAALCRLAYHLAHLGGTLAFGKPKR
ncbi:MAG: hypothetical protein QHH26_11970 [Armatimonadota bacterium]|nr:hypothetical protein [Armatimonadota bacterium]